jgi:O-antigen ligase
MNIRSFFLFFLSASIVTSGISVSLGQGFLALSFICFLFVKENISPIKNIFLISLVFWGFEIGVLFIHTALSGFDWLYFKKGINSEPKDLFLFLGFIVMTKLRREDLSLVYRSFAGLAILLVSTGLLSAFSEYRLAWMFSSLWREMTTWGKQHHIANLGNIRVYLPIGLMNTHLTFGGLLLLTYPWIFFRFLVSFENRESWKMRGLWLSILSIGSFVFLLNNARSSIAGTIIAIVFGYFLWRKKGFKFKIPLWIPTSFLLLATISSVFLWQSSESFRTIIGPILGSEKHTDSGRTFIWDSTFPLIAENPILGIGPGNYSQEIEISRKQRSLDYPDLLFFYEVTQRGHAHNDYFHLAVIFGIPTLLVFLIFQFILAKEILMSQLGFPEIGWFLGLIGFFFASLLQCYFQDDEVVILFWFLVGYFYQSNLLNQYNPKNPIS